MLKLHQNWNWWLQKQTVFYLTKYADEFEVQWALSGDQKVELWLTMQNFQKIGIKTIQKF